MKTLLQKTNSSKHASTFSRRQFLRSSGHGVAAATLMGSMQLGAMATASAQENNDYKALVCILLAGGADSFNMLIPNDGTNYAEYAQTRTDLAIPQSQILPLNNATSNGRSLGVHPGMAELQGLYNSGELAFLSNVGTLVEPTTTQALNSGNAKLPLGLYSHSDQISQWQTAIPDARSATGWGGRMSDILMSGNNNQNISMSISTAGANEFQAGRVTDYYAIQPGGNPTADLSVFEDNEQMSVQGRNAVNQMYGNQYQNLFRRTYSKLFNDSISANQQFAQAIQAAPAFTTQFPANELGAQLQVIARTIAANQSLGMKRQTFFVTFGGWDHHDEVINAMGAMVPVVSQSMAAFNSAMKEIGMANNVTTFTTSDFARTLSSNGRGSDHGWGGNAMIMGGAVKGGNVYGTYPSLALGNPLDTGRGVLMPTTSLDEYFGELALWFGVAPGALSDILPNIGRFYNTGSSNKPIGFMS